MAELKTKRTGRSVTAFLKTIADEQPRDNCRALAAIIEQATSGKAEMWGTDIVDFDTYHYEYRSGREREWMLTAFAPRKDKSPSTSLPRFEQHDRLRAQLGPHRVGKSCIHIKRLAMWTCRH